MSCCSLDPKITNYSLKLDPISISQNFSSSGQEEITVTGKIQHTYHLGYKIQLTFQRIELLEKIAEVSDEIFHLLNKVFRQLCSHPIYNLLSDIHHAAHQLEHLFHSFCFIGDVCRFSNWVYACHQKKRLTKLTLIFAAIRTCHAVSHLIASLSFLQDLELIKSQKLTKIRAYQHLLSASGYGIQTVQLIWQRMHGQHSKHFKSDLCIHAGGFIYESLLFAKQFKNISQRFPYLNQVIALAGIVHAMSVIARLLPPDHQHVSQTITVTLQLDK